MGPENVNVSNGAKDEEEGEKGKHERQMINDRRVHFQKSGRRIAQRSLINEQAKRDSPPDFFLIRNKNSKNVSFFFRAAAARKKTRRRWRRATDKNFLL